MITVRPAEPGDVDRLISLKAQAFNINQIGQDRERSGPRIEQLQVAEVDGRVVGTTRAIPFGHFFGGRAVDAAGISGVAVAAEARGLGVGSVMMRELLKGLRAHTPISSLYPATVPIYRSVGYGFGGVRTFWKTRLDALPHRAVLKAEPFEDADVPAVNVAYERLASGANGLLRRTDGDWWNWRVFTDWNERTMYRYLVREEGEVTGWIVYVLEPGGQNQWMSNINARDLHWTTPAAGRALLSLASLHRSTSQDITWPGPPTDPLADLMIEDPLENAGTFRWMLRLLDVPGAIEARGYSRLIEATVTIDVADPLFPENAGPWRIEVSGGQAKVFPAEQADASADVQTWASIWASFLRPRDAIRLGGLRATPDAIEALELIFGGPLPWIADFF